MGSDNTPRKVYSDVATEASKPIKDRSSVVEGRNGTLPPRRHHLAESDQNALLKKAKEAKRFASPYKGYGAYDGVVEALSRLGENETHLLGDVVTEFEAYMSEKESTDRAGLTAWERFRDKKARSKKSGLDYHGRLQQNLHVLQRLGGDHPYGLKLAQLGCCIDIIKGESGQQLVKLRTQIGKGEEVRPVNEFKVRNYPTSVDSVPSLLSFRAGPAEGQKEKKTNE